MIDVVVALTALAYGIGSAVIPVLNAEAYVAAAAIVLSGPDTVLMVVGMAVGTTVGKCALFLAARAGRDVSRRRASTRDATGRETGREPGRVRVAVQRAGELLLAWLERPWLAIVTILVASLVGVPPLLAVAVAAGVSRMRLAVFAGAVLLGRAGRFVLIAGAAHGLV